MRRIGLKKPWHGSWQRDQALLIIVEVLVKAQGIVYNSGFRNFNAHLQLC